jgi:hypothetical protein
MPIQSLELTDHSLSTAFNLLKAADICDICLVVFADITKHLQNWVPTNHERYQAVTISYRFVLMDYFTSMKSSIIKAMGTGCHQIPYADILEITGYGSPGTGPWNEGDKITLFQWTQLSEETLLNTHPLTLIHLMSIIIDTGMNCLEAKLTSPKQKEWLRNSKILFAQIEQELQTVISQTKVEIPLPRVRLVQLKVLTRMKSH